MAKRLHSGVTHQRHIEKPQLLLLDDDPIFCKLMENTAQDLGQRLTTCYELEEFGQLPQHHDFDIAVVDYFLEGVTGLDMAHLLEDKPVFLVSEGLGTRRSHEFWPENIVGFFSKRKGPEAILEGICRWEKNLWSRVRKKAKPSDS